MFEFWKKNDRPTHTEFLLLIYLLVTIYWFALRQLLLGIQSMLSKLRGWFKPTKIRPTIRILHFTNRKHYNYYFELCLASVESPELTPSWGVEVEHGYEAGSLLLNDIKHGLVLGCTDDTHFWHAVRFMTDAARREQETMKKKATPKLSLSITGSVSRNSTATPPRHTSGNLTPPVTPPITPSSSFRSSTPTGTAGVCVEMLQERRKDGLLCVWSDWKCWNWLMQINATGCNRRNLQLLLRHWEKYLFKSSDAVMSKWKYL